MVPSLGSPSLESGSRLLGACAVLSAIAAAVVLLLPRPLADAFFAAWVLGSVAVALVGGVAAWTNRTPLVWVAALLLTGISVVGMWSIGLFVAPAAGFLLGAAVLSRLAGPRAGVRQTILADPPTVPEAVLKTLAGTGGLVVGSALVYAGAVTRDLFGPCARETLACAVGRTHWDAVGVTVLGLVAAGLGGWLTWKQVHVARVLAAERPE